MQTVKAQASLNGGLSRVDEFEAPAPGGRIDLSRIPNETLRAEIALHADGSALVPVFETSIRRAAGVLVGPGGIRVELAADVGEIIAGAFRAKIVEVEFELIEGPVAGLYDLALSLFPKGGVRFSWLSKAARGYLLAEDGRIEPRPGPRFAETVRLTEGMNAEAAAQAILRECLAQVAENMCFAADACEPEGPHQLRVGLRRLRSALSVFAPVLCGPSATRLGQEAKWLASEAGRLRDLEVATEDIVRREALAHPDEPGFAVLEAGLLAAAEAERSKLGETLGSARAQSFLFNLAQFVECRGWLSPEDQGQTARLAEPAPALARRALEKAWRHVAKRARDLETLDVDARHELRKSLKRLRYATEFLSPLFRPKKVSAFLRRLKAMQEMFGALNDLAMVEALFARQGAIGEGDPAAQRAVGCVIGAAGVRSSLTWRRATKLWRELEAAKPFWR